jgi:hypothetical protein
MDPAVLNNLAVFFAVVFYAFFFTVYLLRARELSKLEWKLSPVLEHSRYEAKMHAYVDG